MEMDFWQQTMSTALASSATGLYMIVVYGILVHFVFF